MKRTITVHIGEQGHLVGHLSMERFGAPGAKDAGVRAAEASLVETEGLPVAIVRRFDRVEGLRIPYVSAATLLGVSPHDPESHTYMEIVDALRTHGDDLIHELEERVAARRIGTSA